MSQRFGDLELALPPKWTDQSVLTFVRPSDRPAGVAGAPDLQRNFVLVRAPADGSFGLKDLAPQHLARLQAAIPQIEGLKEGEEVIDGAPALIREVRFPTPGHGLAQQLHVFLIHGDQAFTMVGTGSAGLVFEGLRKELLLLVRSFRRITSA